MEEKQLKKAEYNRRYREKKKAPKIDIESQLEEHIEEEEPVKTKKRPAAKKEEDVPSEELISLEEYVEALVDQKTKKKKLSTEPQAAGSTSSYSSLFYLVPLLIPFIRAVSDVGMKYITPKKQEPEELHTVSLSTLLPQ